MDHVEVNVVQLQLLETGVDGCRNVCNRVEDLGRHEQLVAGHSARLDGNPNFLFGPICLGAVNVGKTMGNRLLEDLDELVIDGSLPILLVDYHVVPVPKPICNTNFISGPCSN